MKILAISPHLDDAVLSAGGTIHDLVANGHEVSVLTIFAGRAEPPYSALAQSLHELWGRPRDPIGARRLEDMSAMNCLGATPLHSDFLDTIYRNPDKGWKLADDETLTSALANASLMGEIIAALGEQLSCGPDIVLTASAIGDHVDHFLARDAALVACRDAGVPVRLWQDLPYAGSTDEIPRLPSGLRVGRPERTLISPAGWAAKCAAVASYASQLRMLWPDHADFRIPLAAHARAAGAQDGDQFAEVSWCVDVA